MSGQNLGANVILFGGVEVDLSQIDFNDRTSRVGTVKITNIVLIVLVVSIVTLRLAARAIFVRNIFADDSMYVIDYGDKLH
jgi:hypothetical protein